MNKNLLQDKINISTSINMKPAIIVAEYYKTIILQIKILLVYLYLLKNRRCVCKRLNRLRSVKYFSSINLALKSHHISIFLPLRI